MLVSDMVNRLATYYRRHGLWASLRRAANFAKRLLFLNKMVVFYWDLTARNTSPENNMLPDHMSVERKNSVEEIDPGDWHQIIGFHNPMLGERLLLQRLGQGASIWLMRSEGKLAAHGWTVMGRTLEPYYYPLGAGDVHVYDFLVFPEYRGRRLLPTLLNHILTEMSSKSLHRAHFDVAEWNYASLSSTSKTAYPRHLLGVARKITVLGHTFVEWTPLRHLP